MQEYEGGRDMKFGEMLGWALRLRPFGVLRAWVSMTGHKLFQRILKGKF